MADPIPGLMAQVDGKRMFGTICYLGKDPLPFRKLNYTRPGAAQCSLYEADDYLQGQNGDPFYHTEGDVLENVDVENLVMATQMSLAAAIHVDLG